MTSRVPFQFLTEGNFSLQEGSEKNPSRKNQQKAMQHRDLNTNTKDLNNNIDKEKTKAKERKDAPLKIAESRELMRRQSSYREVGDGEEEDGVFAMTGIGEEMTASNEKTRGRKPKTTLRSKLFATLNVSDYTVKEAEENGPLQPGYIFYQLLSHSRGVNVPIPDTFVIDSNNRISHLCNDKKGYIQRIRPDETSSEWKEEFVSQFVTRCLANSKSVGCDYQPLSQRIVAVLKRPKWRHSVHNSLLTLTPLALQTHMLDSMDMADVVLQKHVKSKGRKPNLTRLFWKHTNGTKSVVGWNLSNESEFASSGQPSHAHGGSHHMNRLKTTPEMDLIRSEAISEEQFASDLRNLMYMAPSERSQVKVVESKNFKKFGYLNVCTLTNDDGCVTDTEMERVSPFKMSPMTIEEPELYTERIIHFIQKYAEVCLGVSVGVSEIVCDYIKDDDDKWWFIQVKALRFCQKSQQRLRRWMRNKARREEDIFEEEDDEGKESFQDQYKRKIREAREKAKEGMEHQCKFCGIFYGEGEVMSKTSLNIIDTTEEDERKLEKELLRQKHAEQESQRRHLELLRSGSQTPGDQCKEASLAPQINTPNPSRNKTAAEMIADHEGVDVDKMPAYGYHITYKMAILLAEIFRNNGLRLSKYCHDILVNEAQYNQSLLPGSQSINMGSSLRIGQKEKRPDDHVMCCLRCFYVLENYFEHKEAGLKLYEVLGMTKGGDAADDLDANEVDDCSAAELFRLNTGRSIPHRHSSKAEKLRKSLSASKKLSTVSLIETAATKLIDMHNSNRSLQSACSTSIEPRKSSPHDAIEKDFVFKGERCPFTSQHFESDTLQWRMIFLFHSLLDVEVPLVLSDVLSLTASGRNKHMEASGLGSEYSGKCVEMRQCRLHYLFASQKGALATFAPKKVEFHMFFTPDSEHVPAGKEELRWEGCFSIDLNRLLFNKSSVGDDKFDIFIPVNTQTMGNLIAKVSVSVAMSDHICDDVHTLKFHKEKQVFWPPTSFTDYTALPDAWLAMMTSIQLESSSKPKRDQNAYGTDGFDSHIIAEGDLAAYVQICRRVFHSEIMSDGSSNCADVLEQLKVILKNDSSVSAYAEPLVWAADQMLEDASHLPTRLRFEDFMAMIIFQIEQWMEEGQNEDCGHDSAPRDEMEVQAKAAKRDVARLSSRLTNILGVPFHGSFTSKSHRGSKISIKDKSDQPSDDEAPSPKNSVMEAYMNHSSRRNRRLSQMASAVYKHVLGDCDMMNDQSCLKSDDVGSSLYGLSQCAPSRARRHRRGLVLLTIFEAVGKYSDMVDIAELKQYMIEESNKLSNLLSLIKTRQMKLPTIKHRFDNYLRDQFSILRSLICSILLENCHQLVKKFEEYDSKGTGSITEISFVTICESGFRDVSEIRNVSELPSSVRDLKREGERVFVSACESNPSALVAKRLAKRGKLKSNDDSDVSNKPIYEFEQMDESPDEQPAENRTPTFEESNNASSPIDAARRSRASIHSETIRRHHSSQSCNQLDVDEKLDEFNFDKTPVAVWLNCDLHGFGYFFVADLCCVKCETEVYQSQNAV